MAVPAAHAATPRIKSVECVAQCSGDQPRGGSLLLVRGSRLGNVSRAYFAGGEGGVKAVRGRARASSTSEVKVRVPWEAVTGDLTVGTTAGETSEPQAVEMADVPVVSKMTCRSSCAPGRKIRGGSLVEVTGVRLDSVKDAVLKGGRGRSDDRRARVSNQTFTGFRMRVPGDGRSGKVFARTPDRGTSPGRKITVTGRAVPVARVINGGVFPVRGTHNFGQEGARFGAGRGGRSHQGQDVMAACGTPMVAAVGGKVKYTGTQSAAGNYLVIRGANPAWDYVYMHLESKPLVKKGATVATGQSIGTVGATGNARGCHLHFELWEAPGWYDGGQPFDPLPQLKAWDGQGPPPTQLARR